MYSKEHPWDPRPRVPSGSSYIPPRPTSHLPQRSHPTPSPFDARPADRTDHYSGRYEPRARSSSKEDFRASRPYQPPRDRQRSASPVRDRPVERSRESNHGCRPESRPSTTPRESVSRDAVPEKRGPLTRESVTRGDSGSGSRQKDVVMADVTEARASPAASVVESGNGPSASREHDTTQRFVKRLTETQRAFEKARDARDHLDQFQKFKAQRALDPRETAEIEKKIEEKEVALREAERISTHRMKALRDATDAVLRESMKAVMGTQTPRDVNGVAAVPAANGNAPAPTAVAAPPPAKSTPDILPPIATPITSSVGPHTPAERSDVPTSRIKAKAAVADKLERLVTDMDNMQSLVYTLEDNTTDREAALREQIADLDKTVSLEKRARQMDRANQAKQREFDLATFEETRAQDLAAHAAQLKARDDADAQWRKRMEAKMKEADDRFAKLSALGARQLEAVTGFRNEQSNTGI